MQSFSTAAFVAALALAPSALAADSVSKQSTYANTDCSGDASYAFYMDYVIISDASETVAASACALTAAACAEDGMGGSVVTTCTDSIDVGSGPYTGYYGSSDTSCSNLAMATVYSSTCVQYGSDYSIQHECSSSTVTQNFCMSDTSCGGTCSEVDSYPTTCTVVTSDDDGNGNYEKASCGSSSDDVCFSGDDTLLLESGVAKRLSEVAIGDKVQTADANGVLSFSEVVALPHAANNKLASFVNVATASGKSIKATKMHLLQQCDGALAYAGSLAAGDCLRTVDGDEAVTAVSMTKAEGIYTAVTTNEFLVVNGIVASPFAVSHGLASAYYNAHRFVAKVFPSALKSPLVFAANAFLTGAFFTAAGSK